MDATEIIVQVVHGRGVGVIEQLLAKAVGLMCESPLRHPQCQILALNPRRADLGKIGLTYDQLGL